MRAPLLPLQMLVCLLPVLRHWRQGQQPQVQREPHPCNYQLMAFGPTRRG